MDGEGAKPYRYWDEVIFFLAALFVIGSIFSGTSNAVSSGSPTSNFFAQILGINPALNAQTPIGTAIVNNNRTLLYDRPGGEVIGEMPKDATGIVIGGPVLLDGVLWWEVEYDDGTVGWVSGDDIGIDIERDQKMLKENSPHGTKVVASERATILSNPPDGLVVGRTTVGDEGVVIGGPVTHDGVRYWQVRWSDGTVGWISEDALEIDVERNKAGINDNTLLGTPIRTTTAIDVWSAPRGGNVLGRQVEGAEGILVDGAVTTGTTRWWDVDFENAPDGWVFERNLERVIPLQDAADKTRSFFVSVLRIISILLFAGIVYVFYKLQSVYRQEHAMFSPITDINTKKVDKNEKWERVLQHVESDNPNDWRLAIIEADVILDRVVENMYLPGDTLGERLKSVERSDFTTIDQAWEAHKIRNRIAHDGGEYIVTQREAKRVIDLYKQVFDEFHVI